MLVISRKHRESLLLGKDITVTILDVRSDQVKLGIDAPAEVRVVRSELLTEVGLRNRNAAGLQLSDLQNLRGKRRPDPEPEVFITVETDCLATTVSKYQALGFRLYRLDQDQAWLERAQVWIRCSLAAVPRCGLELGFHRAPDAASIASLITL